MKKVLSAFVILLSALTFLLSFEWYQVSAYAAQLRELKEDYAAYIALLKKKTPGENDGDDACTVNLNQFVQLNRDFDALKDIALLYNSHELDDNELELLYKPYDVFEQPEKPEPKASPAVSSLPAPSSSSSMPRAQSTLSWPLEKGLYWLSSPFGPRKKADGSPGFHQGLDLAAPRGTPVKAAASGPVIEAGYAKGYGNTIVIMHNKKYKTRYAHLSKIYVKRNQKIERGRVIGAVGNTGLVRSSGGDGSHLHFEVYVFGKRVNPRYVLP